MGVGGGAVVRCRSAARKGVRYFLQPWKSCRNALLDMVVLASKNSVALVWFGKWQVLFCAESGKRCL